MPRLDTERQNELEPIRMQIAMESMESIEAMGYEPYKVNESLIEFYYEGAKIMFYPYSGWHSGKTIKDGRGLKNLLRQIKQKLK